MGLQQLNLWKITCDQCGVSTLIETHMDFNPTGQDLINHGFIKVLDVPLTGYGSREEHYYCEQCAHALMTDKKGKW